MMLACPMDVDQLAHAEMARHFAAAAHATHFAAAAHATPFPMDVDQCSGFGVCTRTIDSCGGDKRKMGFDGAAAESNPEGECETIDSDGELAQIIREQQEEDLVYLGARADVARKFTWCMY